MRTDGFDAVLGSSSFCLEMNDQGNLALKQEHSYYYQCQLQMVATSRSYCDFVVWSACEALHIERITFNKTFIDEKLKQAERLFWLAIIPELLGKWFTRDHIKLPTVDHDENDDDVGQTEEDDGRWCFCKTPKGGSMIGCEDPSCVTKWFHLSCLRMEKCPKNKWFCPNCYALRSIKKSKSTKK